MSICHNASYLKYDERSGSFFMAKMGFNDQRPEMVLIAQNEPPAKLNAFSNLVRMMNEDLEKDGERFYSAEALISVWEIFDVGFEAGRHVAEQPLKRIMDN